MSEFLLIRAFPCCLAEASLSAPAQLVFVLKWEIDGGTNETESCRPKGTISSNPLFRMWWKLMRSMRDELRGILGRQIWFMRLQHLYADELCFPTGWMVCFSPHRLWFDRCFRNQDCAFLSLPYVHLTCAESGNSFSEAKLVLHRFRLCINM